MRDCDALVIHSGVIPSAFIPFVKMHGLGNDYVYLDAVADAGLERREDLPALARAISDRHTGVGSDGLILVCVPSGAGRAGGDGGGRAHVRMRMFNADGSESEMCGNGVRCVAKFAHDRLGVRHRPMRVETGRGVLAIDYAVDGAGRLSTATVDMGAPILEAARVPVDERAAPLTHGHRRRAPAGHEALGEFVAVSMGNPHAVFFCPGFFERPERGPTAARALMDVGPALEGHAAFPRRANIHIVRARGRDRAEMLTWERGAGMTRACGTGACAVLVAGVLTGTLDREATLTLPGGDLRVRWDEASGHVFMTGPAEYVCEGVWPGGPASAAVAGEPRPTITTDRLVLRPAVLEDAAAVASLAGDRRVYDMTLLIPHPYREEDATRWIAGHAREWAARSALNLLVTMRGTGETIGAIGLVYVPRQPVAEMGYWIAPAHWGRGYATEAARALAEHALAVLGVRRLFAYHFVENPASGRVLEKAGFTREGTARSFRFKHGEGRDSVLWARVRGGA